MQETTEITQNWTGIFNLMNEVMAPFLPMLVIFFVFYLILIIFNGLFNSVQPKPTDELIKDKMPKTERKEGKYCNQCNYKPPTAFDYEKSDHYCFECGSELKED